MPYKDGAIRHMDKLQAAIKEGDSKAAELISYDYQMAEYRSGKGVETAAIRMTRQEYDYLTERWGSASRGLRALINMEMGAKP